MSLSVCLLQTGLCWSSHFVPQPHSSRATCSMFRVHVSPGRGECRDGLGKLQKSYPREHTIPPPKIGSQEERPAGGGLPSIRPLSPRASDGQHLHPSPLDSACFRLGPSSSIPQAQPRWSCGEGGGVRTSCPSKGPTLGSRPFP